MGIIAMSALGSAVAWVALILALAAAALGGVALWNTSRLAAMGRKLEVAITYMAQAQVQAAVDAMNAAETA